MPLIVVNDLLFIWGSVGSVSINSCNVGMLEGEISWTGGGFFGGGGVVGGRDWCCVGCSLCAFCGWFGRSATVELSKDLRGL